MTLNLVRFKIRVMVEKIYKRDVADEILKYLGTDNIIVLHGSRQVG
ncbi:MAG: hypothetical protein ACD_50C00106G0001, partial [uncultured bacterium]